MNKNKECVICSHLYPDREKEDKLFNQDIFNGTSNPDKFKFCFQHDMELFHVGQIRFLKKYSYLILNFTNESFNPKFISILKNYNR